MASNRTIRNNSGVILMETLLTLPVYLVMLAGLFWLGELCATRNTLIQGERLRIWEAGTRSISGQTIPSFGSRGLFFFLPETRADARSATVTGASDFKLYHNTAGGAAEGVKREDSSLQWGWLQSGYAKINTRRSNWSWTIADFSNKSVWNVRSGDPHDVFGANRKELIARGNLLDPLSSAVFFRQGDGGRTGDNSYVGSNEYQNIYGESWPANLTMENQGSASAISTYSRNKNYVTWSE